MFYGDKEIQVEVGFYCRWFRMFKLDVTLKEVMGSEHVKLLSAFEHGRSSNMLILLEYVRLAEEYDELGEFLYGLMDTVLNRPWREE